MHGSIDKNGAPAGGEIAINQATGGDQQSPAVAYDPSGLFFTVVWEGQGPVTTGWDVLARQFNAGTGAPLAGDGRLNGTLAGDQRHPALALQPGGSLAVAWEGPDGDGTGVFLRAFTSALVPSSGEVAANTVTAGFQSNPAIGCADSGSCVAAWESSGQDGSGSGIYARRFDRNLAPLAAPEIRVNTTTDGLQAAPTVATFSTGDFLIAWESAGQGAGSGGVYAQSYDFRALPQGGEQQVNTFVPGDQRRARLAAADHAVPGELPGLCPAGLRGEPNRHPLWRGRQLRGPVGRDGHGALEQRSGDDRRGAPQSLLDQWPHPGESHDHPLPGARPEQGRDLPLGDRDLCGGAL